MNQKITSRIAPTPSGFLHAGNVYNFLLTYLFTRAFDGKLYLRIDDYDLPRYRRQYVENIFLVLDMLGIDFDGGPGGVGEFETKFSSKFRLGAYQNALKKLEQKGVCYACECSHSMKNSFKNGIYMRVCADKNLKFKKDETAIRLRVLDVAEICVRQNLINFDALCGKPDGAANQTGGLWGSEQKAQNGVANGLKNLEKLGDSGGAKPGGEKFSFNATENLNSANLGVLNLTDETAFEAEKFAQAQSVNLAQILGDFVIWKKDDTPAYNLASLVDDEILGVNLLVRGEDLLACSAAQKYMAQMLGYDFAGANFIHHGLLAHGGKKLSKSSSAPAVSVADGAKIHYKFAALKLGLDASKCDALSNLLEMFEEKFSR
ncbi:glutamyl-queuosine tRNA(Asp) synthetase [Campylobacter showae]|uniref:Glutamate--tRNA ligase n=1 Tax=Campylobacter showae RM3277 TaxID=553219 RepID=C6RFY6_9BACT|nr:tRNA glutamyl-Q synthetase [Campylobacter showae]EET79681.1 glutamate--tRNA ligase [Campylobacter showae RM3277]QCD48547.1 glutamyl-queuosine tRNA(Asp) synthetase [Campylobacter showae]